MGDENGGTLFTLKSKGLMKSHTIALDGDGNALAYMIIYKKGLAFSINYILKTTPSFPGQEKVTDDELARAGIEAGTELYVFSIINAKNSLSSAESTYSIVTGKGEGDEFETKPLYTAKK